MKTFTRIFCLLAIILCAAWGNAALAQTGVLNPDDPIVVYNPSAPPATPPYGTLAKWVKTNRVSYNTSSFKAYYYKGMAFRLKFPKSYKDSLGTGKKYPIFVFFHGIGEKGTVYDNEYQLYHGGQRFMNYVDNGSFDGFLLYPQTSSGSGAFNTGHYQNVKELIENYFVPEINVDINRVIVDGLSGGGGATWQMLTNHTQLVAAGLPISAVSVADGDASKVQALKWTPIWLFQGGLDKSPAPFTARGVVSNYRNAGSNISYTEYPNLGHGCWNTAWVEPQFVPFMNKAHKANPWPLNGRTEFCPGDPISQVIGVTAGFSGYEWRKNGELISGATSNSITATSVGVYSVRIRRGTEWSPWSPIPVEIKLKGATVSPDIQAEAGTTRVIPAPDGTNSVQLFVPEGYTSYQWVKDGSATVLGTSNTYVATSAGAYRVKVTEEFGCSSEFSNPFTVIDANGANGPSAASGVIATVLSKTSIRLDWNQSSNPAPGTNETGFEIYRSLSSGSGYSLIATTAADATGFTDTDLNSNTQYFYRVRAINLNGASSTSDPVNGTTLSDVQAPSAPGSLSITGTTRNSVSLTWSESLDDVGVVAYDIFVNGVKFYETELTAFTVYNLQYGQSYNFKVQARDFAGNKSPFSSQVTGQPLLNGLNYKYYTFTGTWNNLPNFNDLDPVATGVVPNVTLAPRSQNDNFAFLWEGFINITQAGTYYFRTNSDDGSRLWLGALGQTASPYSFGTASTVNNDGLHGSQNRESVALNLAVGVYPIAIAFYEQGGGEAMTVSWRTPSTGSSYVTIPNSAFSDPPVNNGSAPAAPSGLSANAVSYKRINLAWTDNSNNESGFEVWRSTNPTDDYAIIGTAVANANTFADTLGLDASTTYYYRLRSIGQYGESSFIPAETTDAQAQWRFNGNLTDASGNGRTITGSNNPGYDANDKKEGSHAITFNGSNQHLDVATSSGDYIRGGYSSKSISFWMKSNSNTGNRIVVDFGGNDDGLAIRLDANRLYAGVASTPLLFVTRKNISVPYTSTDWNYVTVVYDANSLKLYLNGAEVAADNNLGFSSVNSTSNASRIGTVNSSNAFNTGTGRFSGKLDDFVVFERALSVADINQLMNDSYGKVLATTLALPPAPAAPTGLEANGTSTSSIAVTWADNANNEEKYELYRSATSDGVYVLLANLPANTASYSDTALLSNAVFYYKVRAVNEGGNSAYTNTDSAATQNNAPAITAIANQYMRFGTQLELPVSATDADPETLTLQVSNLPAFGTFQNTGNGTGTLSFSPALADAGTYNDITVTVTDEHGGSATTVFNLVVDANYQPVVAAVSNVALNEKATAQINLSATDENENDALSWSFTGLPSFVTVTTNGGTAQLDLAPGYADNGTYQVTARVEDGNNGFDTTSFTITVNDVDPVKVIYMNFGDATYTAGAPWNNTAKAPAVNDNFANLKDATGATTSVGIQLLTAWSGINNLGMNTGSNSGVYPDAVLRSSYYTTTIARSVRVYGLDANTQYNFRFLGSRANPNAGVGVTTTYTIGATTVSLDAKDNAQNTAQISSVQPAADGSVTFVVNAAAGSSFGYLNSLVIESIFDDQTAPAKARNLSAQNVDGKVRLNWTDAAYNETSYEVFRATNIAGPFTLIHTGAANLVQHEDAAVAGNTTYYYTVRAANSYGNAPYSDTVSITTPNVPPVLNPIANVTLNTQQSTTVAVSATDPGDAITLSASNLPSFATFTDNGNGTGSIQINAGNTPGVYSGITITASDNFGGSSSQQFTITVNVANLTKVFVNFNQTFPVGSPWNSTNAAPNAGLTLADLKDQTNNSTGITLTVLDAWTAHNTLGVVTGNNSGVYPDDVMRTFYYYSGTAERRIRLSGLSADKKYDLSFFASRANFSTPLTTRYTVNGNSVEVDATNNSSNVGKLDGISPDSNGEILITVLKSGSSANAYLGALVIDAYPLGSTTPVAPTNLTATGISKTQIRLNWGATVGATGYEIFRSTSEAGSYSKIGDVPTGTLTYTDASLSAGAVRYYQVRATVSSGVTPFSNTAAASTVAYVINLNMNDGTANAPAQPGNWNNTNALIADGFVLPNMINDQGQATGINFGVTTAFSGFNYFGTTTGNNSGIYPDNVMKSFYYVNFADTARLRITGLTLAHEYNFAFFGSRVNPQVGVITAYKIGDQIVTLNAGNNTQNVAKISGVKPDADGSVSITIYGTVQGGFGYLNAMTIEGAPTIATQTQPDVAITTGTIAQSAITSAITLKTAQDDEQVRIVKATAFPNPFVDDITVELKLTSDVSRFTVQVVDMNGKVVYSKDVANAQKGTWLQKLGLNSRLSKGMYFIRVNGLPGQGVQILKVVKR